MSDAIQGISAISKGNEAAALRCVQPHLQEGEEVVLSGAFRANRGWPKRLRFARIDVQPAAFEVPDPTVLGVTSRRFLLATHGYAEDFRSELMVEVPLEEVRSVERDGARVGWSARGTQYTLWSNGSYAKTVAGALQHDA